MIFLSIFIFLQTVQYSFDIILLIPYNSFPQKSENNIFFLFFLTSFVNLNIFNLGLVYYQSCDLPSPHHHSYFLFINIHNQMVGITVILKGREWLLESKPTKWIIPVIFNQQLYTVKTFYWCQIQNNVLYNTALLAQPPYLASHSH